MPEDPDSGTGPGTVEKNFRTWGGPSSYLVRYSR
jgi:hypothetical protein